MRQLCVQGDSAAHSTSVSIWLNLALRNNILRDYNMQYVKILYSLGLFQSNILHIVVVKKFLRMVSLHHASCLPDT